MSPEERYAEANGEAARKKAAFVSSAATAKARLSPARLKQDVKDKAFNSVQKGKTKIAATVQRRPLAAGAAATALTLYLFRRPVSALLKRMYVRITNRQPEESETDDG